MLSDYAHGQGSAPVRRLMDDLQKLPTASSSSSTTTASASVAVAVDEDKLLTFMHVYLIFLAEVTKRRGCSRADALLQQLLNGRGYARGFTHYNRCMFYAMFDTTSLWILSTWISPASCNVLTGAVLLFHLAVAVVCFNGHRVLDRFPGCKGFGRSMDAMTFYREHAKVPDLPHAPVGGITGVGRHALMGLLRDLGIVHAEQKHYDFFVAMGLYIQHCSQVNEEAWQKLEAVRDAEEANKNEEVIKILQQCFFLPTLCAIQVARFLGATDKRFFDASTCDHLGPNALSFLQTLFPSEKAALEDSVVWRRYLHRLAELMVARLPDFSFLAFSSFSKRLLLLTSEHH